MRERAAKRVVELLGFPVAIYLESRAHTDSLARELALMAMGGPAPRAPAEQVGELVDTYSATLSSASWQDTHRRILEAQERGEATVDLRFTLPVDAVPGIERYRALLEEAEEYCRNGALLTVEAPPAVRAWRTWYFDQLISQLRDGTLPRRFSPS